MSIWDSIYGPSFKAPEGTKGGLTEEFAEKMRIANETDNFKDVDQCVMCGCAYDLHMKPMKSRKTGRTVFGPMCEDCLSR